MKKVQKKLVLHRESLRNLSGPSLKAAFGGTTGASYCYDCGYTENHGCDSMTECMGWMD